MKRDYPMHHLQSCRKCGARTRRGTPCRSPAMKNGRCRIHGGLSLAGKESPRYRHGHYTREAIAERHEIAALVGRSRKALGLFLS